MSYVDIYELCNDKHKVHKIRTIELYIYLSTYMNKITLFSYLHGIRA